MLTFSSPVHHTIKVSCTLYFILYILYFCYIFIKSLPLFADILHLGLTLSLKSSYNHWPAFIVHYVKPKLQKEDYFSLRVVSRH